MGLGQELRCEPSLKTLRFLATCLWIISGKKAKPKSSNSKQYIPRLRKSDFYGGEALSVVGVKHTAMPQGGSCSSASPALWWGQTVRSGEPQCMLGSARWLPAGIRGIWDLLFKGWALDSPNAWKTNSLTYLLLPFGFTRGGNGIENVHYS